ncbi:MAG TPA: bifunctional UDP-N-acetylmuramoyl-tripeptide:D-alanyl-D-alanine ligase/alanine racemase [Bacteroidales bacterium]|nr:bifunctional UDP-N-acetylmuramoyl-tripeptide:D-alanyl-D-alanine ligase/alanine racemase [Bacteroidales bacterium]
MDFTVSDIARLTGGKLTGPPDPIVRELLTDSRHVSYTENAAFVAIKGVNHDGHKYIDNLYRRGVKVFIASQLPGNPDLYPDASFIICQNSIDALQLLAAAKRALFGSVVFAVTGSAGKTIVKEWLADVLGRVYPVVRSPKSYNSQIGVPLSVWKLDPLYKFGIFEAGISLPGEMEKLRKVIDPDIGIITNIGDAHSENFPDIRTKAKEKLRLFANAKSLIYSSDSPIIREAILEDPVLREKNLTDWSFTNRGARVFVEMSSQGSEGTHLKFTYKGSMISAVIPFRDRASIENAVTVASACLTVGLPVENIVAGLAGLVSVAMRMELKEGINNCQLIEDYYNSDPGSLKLALEYLKTQNNRRTTLILSDFIQSGREEKELYSEVAALVRKTGIDKFIGIGRALMKNSSLFDEEAKFFYSTDDFIHNFNSQNFNNEVVLLKGARVFELERIARLLEQQVHITVLEINLDAISENLNEVRKNLNPGTRIMVMVKAFAYGSGPSEISGLLEYHRVSYLGVANTDEGVELRKAGVTIPVIVMNPDISSGAVMIQNNLEPEIYSFQSLERFADAASKYGLYNYPVHIKIDTGMHRLGFMPDDIDRLIKRVKELSCVKIKSVFSHLAAADDPSFDEITHRQASLFISTAERIRSGIGYSFLKHLLNTAGIVRFPQYQFDMVRPGIGIYGAEKYEGITMRPVSRFKTRIIQIKMIPAGEAVGYGFTDRSDSDRNIAILPVGYADGLNRRLGNRKGNLFINGSKVPIIGKICMDLCMADVTGIDASEGDEAEIFGPNIPIGEIAKQCETIPYEILTSIPGRVKRVFYRE